MGESPVFTCMAHVFTIDPRTKKTWLPASMQAISVSFFFDRSREQYRILSVDESATDSTKKMTINSIMTERMSFKKTSQKFGQWADTGNGTVYGLGFTSESELEAFVQQFCDALEHTRRLRKQQPLLPAEIATESRVDLDQDGASESKNAERKMLQTQLQLASKNLQRLEQENQQLRSAKFSETDSKIPVLVKENEFLKAKLRQLEEKLAMQQQQLNELPTVSSELQRRLLDAADLCIQLNQLKPQS